MSAVLVAVAISTASLGATSNLTYLATYSDGLGYPARLEVAPGGGVYVTDPPLNQVIHYDAGGDVIATYTIAQGPVGIAAHPDGRVFVSRNDGAIGVYSSAFVLQGTISAAPFTLTGPNDLVFDSGALELYTVDSGSHRVLVFTESAPGTWTLARSWGMEGVGLGQFAAPQSIALDTVDGRVIVTDADNFRVQVFDTTGLLLFKFGYRILFLADSDTAWFARSEGVAVDACGNIHVVDALMGTLRVFSGAGAELNGMHVPSIGYGTAAGQLRVPCDVLIDGDTLYVANTNNGTVEVFDAACSLSVTADVEAPRIEPAEKPLKTQRPQRYDATTPRGLRWPDSPLEVIAAIDDGEYKHELDLNQDQVLNRADIDLAVAAFGMGSTDGFLVTAAEHPQLDEPHILNLPNRCGRCHSLEGSPGGMLTAAGQENLCQSCHSAGKIAGKKWVGAGDLENSHPWGMAADDADPGPAPGSDVALHLDNGDVRCGTCHDPHQSSTGICVVPSPIPNAGFLSHIGTCVGGAANGKPCQKSSQCDMTYVRTQGDTINLCGECHKEYDEWLNAGHADEHADPWSHYDWSMGNNWLCTGPGTPYAYCTGEGVGTATSPIVAVCTGAGTPYACCTGVGTGPTCFLNASCTGAATPWPCCTGAGTGTCPTSPSLSIAACTGPGTPMACCTGSMTGSCSSRESCRQCHSGNGYIDFAEDFRDNVVVTATHRGAFRVVDCLVCHATHGKYESESLLRIYDDVRLPTGQMVTDSGPAATCIACHNGRAAPPLPNPAGVTTPHYLNGGAMFEGINAVAKFPAGAGPNAACTGAGAPWSCCTAAGSGTCIGPNSDCTGAGTPWSCCTGAGTGTCPTLYALTNSNHSSNASVDCTTCHMAPGPTSGLGVAKVGGHTFNIKWHESGGFFCAGGLNDGESCDVDTDCDLTTSGDGLGSCNPADPDYGFENVGSSCATASCHPGLTTINRTANGDYDGDGTIEGVQDETRGMLALLKGALYTAGASRLLTNEADEVVTEPEICTAAGVPLACCTGPQTGPTCEDPHAQGANPYWTTRRCSGGTRNGLACNGTGAGTAPFNCPGGGACNSTVAAGDFLATVEDAIWNWEFVDNSGDLGVKNTGYAIGLLQVAYKGVTGNAVPGAAYRYSPAP